MSIFKISLVSVRIDVKTKASLDFPFYRIIFRYSKEDWDSFRSYNADAPLWKFFKHAGPQNFCPRLRI